MKNKQQKVLHIIIALNIGGAESTLKRLVIHSQQNSQFQHEIISLMDIGIIGKELQAAGINVHSLEMKSIASIMTVIFKLYKLILSIKPDIVQTWMYHADLLGGIAAKLARVPKIYWSIRHSNLQKDTIKKLTYVVMKTCAHLSNVISTKIISCSRQAIGSHVVQGYVQNKFVLIQNGYDLNNFKPYTQIFENIKFNNNGKPIIAMVARFDIQKDHLNLIKALSILKKKGINFHLVLVGKGMTPDNDILIKYLTQSNLNINEDVTLFGQSENIPLLLNSIDLHVLSSLGEAFPNVLAEAMACGVPCVTTNVGDAREIVEEYGWVVPPQDSIQLSNAISLALNEFITRPELWKIRKGKCVKHISDNFELGSMVNKFHEVWME